MAKCANRWSSFHLSASANLLLVTLEPAIARSAAQLPELRNLRPPRIRPPRVRPPNPGLRSVYWCALRGVRPSTSRLSSIAESVAAEWFDPSAPDPPLGFFSLLPSRASRFCKSRGSLSFLRQSALASPPSGRFVVGSGACRLGLARSASVRRFETRVPLHLLLLLSGVSRLPHCCGSRSALSKANPLSQ